MVSPKNMGVLTGRVTKDIEERRTSSDIPVCNFTIAVDRPGTSRVNRITDFIDCVAWRQNAVNISKFFHRGDPISVTYSLQLDEYKDKDGNNRKKLEVCVDSFEFPLTAKKQTQEQTEVQNDTIPETAPVNTDNLPF